jgi:hypothetical protein
MIPISSVADPGAMTGLNIITIMVVANRIAADLSNRDFIVTVWG